MQRSSVHRPPQHSIESDEHPATPLTAEDLHLRNYDMTRPNRVTIRMERNGRLAFGESYRLGPGAFVSEVDAVPMGTYEVHVETDDRHTTRTCRVDDGYDHTVLIELGNGIVSVTEGVYR